MEASIGSYVSRAETGRPWHRVESIVSGDVITKCGRRLPDEKPLFVRDTLLVRAILVPCSQCGVEM